MNSGKVVRIAWSFNIAVSIIVLIMILWNFVRPMVW